MPIHDDLVSRIWQGRNPFAGFPPNLYPATPEELAHGSHSYLLEAVADIAASLVVEIGVWKGASSIAMAKQMKAIGITGGAVVSIDTWLGSHEHWLPQNGWNASLNLEFGQPMLFRTFMSNVLTQSVSDMILPLPLDSVNANELWKAAGLPLIDVIHIDAGHDYRSVRSDLEAWWPLVRSGGWLIGDDYLHTGEWPGVRQAADEFFDGLGLMPFEFMGNKFRVKKP